MADRGRIAVGMVADLVLFDPEKIIDRATYEMPERVSEGVEMVMASGAVRYQAR